MEIFAHIRISNGKFYMIINIYIDSLTTFSYIIYRKWNKTWCGEFHPISTVMEMW